MTQTAEHATTPAAERSPERNPERTAAVFAAPAYQDAMARLDAVPPDQPILLVTHFHPDGDAIGSLLGLGLALKERGKLVVMADDDGVPDYLQFLPGHDLVVTHVPDVYFPVMVSLDASDEERSGTAGEKGFKRSETVINVDHHATNTGFGQVYVVNAGAVSTTEIVFDWLNALGQAITSPVAQALLTGLVTDTIGFRTPNVTPRTLEVAQALMAAGANLADIIARTLNSTPYTTVAVWRQALQTVQLEDHVIWVTATRVMFKDAGMDETADAGLIGFLNTVNEARAAVSFRDTEDDQVKISFRSKPGVDVSAVAFALGGGGHKQAAGATLPGTLDDARAKVIPMVKAAVAEALARETSAAPAVPPPASEAGG